MRKGFTLVELLAVIVLLGLITLIAFPNILEAMKKTNKNVDNSKLRLMYQGADQYLEKEGDAYPHIEGNTYCISPKFLQEEKYITFEDLPENADDYVIKVSVGSNEKLSYNYVNKYECIEKGVIATNLGSVTCEVDKSGYAVNKKVKIQYPINGDYEYSYSYDGKNWKVFHDTEGEGYQEIPLEEDGYVLARVKEIDSKGYRTCVANVTNIDATPIGTILAYAGKEIPLGYLEANGSEKSMKVYNELYKVIKNSYGSTSSPQTFKLPDIRGRVIVGYQESSDYAEIGSIGGEKSHALTVNELASHTHIFTGSQVTSGNNSGTPSATFVGNSVTTSSDGNHSHSIPALSGTALTAGEHTHNINTLWAGASTGGGKYTIYGYPRTNASGQYSINTETAGVHSHSVTTNASTTDSNGLHNHTVTATGSVTLKDTTHTHSVTAKGTNSNTGKSKSHNNLQPYNTLKYMIKYQ